MKKLAGIIALAVVLLAACVDVPEEVEVGRTAEERDAWSQCEREFLRLIRTPTTAEISDHLFVGFRDLADGKTVYVSFQASYQNLFGATVTDHISCSLVRAGNGWREVEVGRL